MKTILEVFYLRIVGKSVRYQRKHANLSTKGGDPNRMIQSLIQEKRSDSAGNVEEKEFVVHSTSWRYTKPDKIMLTYAAYSDELEFDKGKFHTLPLKKLKTITKKSRKPRSRVALERQVVSHAMRHIAFLIKTEDQSDYKSALTPETKKVFESLWVALAGRVY
ncbi:MAG TPA: hypothetical protein VJM08_03545 [Anaerolineales bacterium]|nr:hypothetical protein [Anaerolineales bacterium]